MNGVTTSAQVPIESRLPPPLESRRAELQRCGFNVIPSIDGVIASRSRFYWDCLFTKLNTMVFVRRVGEIDEDRFEEVKESLFEEAKGLDVSALPRGFQKGSAVVAVLIADRIDDALKEKITQQRTTGGFAKFFFPVLVDASTGASFFFPKTPIVGGVYYAKFRWIAERLANPGGAATTEPVSRLGAALTVFTFGWLALVFGLYLAKP